MTLLQKYLQKQGLVPLLVTLGALSMLAILTQSLSTLDLIVENRQTAFTFFKITALSLPQLIAVILPFSIFIAVLYSINKLNADSELIIAKAAGFSPWKIAYPIIRLSVIAALLHLLINAAIQPASMREMRSQLFSIKTSLAAQIVKGGEFTTPTKGLTIYAKEISPSGAMQDIVIHDERQEEGEQTYFAQSGQISSNSQSPRLTLKHGSLQTLLSSEALDIVAFETYELDLSDIMPAQSEMRLSASDMYLPELLSFTSNNEKSVRRMKTEAHSRLSSPLYNIALALLALCFLIRGPLQRTGYSKRIALCAFVGFLIRLVGYGIESAAQDQSGLNIVQYMWPAVFIIICLVFLLKPGRIRSLRVFKKDNSNLFTSSAA